MNSLIIAEVLHEIHEKIKDHLPLYEGSFEDFTVACFADAIAATAAIASLDGDLPKGVFVSNEEAIEVAEGCFDAVKKFIVAYKKQKASCPISGMVTD
jgi:hypothetical protein